MNKIHWGVAILDVITIVVATIGFIIGKGILPNYAALLGLVSFVLTTIAAVVFGVQVTSLRKQMKDGTPYQNKMNQPK
jgi:hypothetical protein